MPEESDNGRSLATNRTMEILTAFAIIAFSVIVIVSNYRLGAGWSASGPESGYFPFYVGILLFISAGANLIGGLVRSDPSASESFVDRRPFLRVLRILIPTIVYVVAVAYVGIYVASAVFIAFFMIWLGRYNFVVAAAIGVLFSVAMFVTFEVWFLVPLPKGPLESWFGY